MRFTLLTAANIVMSRLFPANTRYLAGRRVSSRQLSRPAVPHWEGNSRPRPAASFGEIAQPHAVARRLPAQGDGDAFALLPAGAVGQPPGERGVTHGLPDRLREPVAAPVKQFQDEGSPRQATTKAVQAVRRRRAG